MLEERFVQSHNIAGSSNPLVERAFILDEKIKVKATSRRFSFMRQYCSSIFVGFLRQTIITLSYRKWLQTRAILLPNNFMPSNALVSFLPILDSHSLAYVALVLK